MRYIVKKYYLRRFALFSILAVFTLFSEVFAQTTKVSGKIVDAISREPLPFVNVLLKGTKSAANSDIEGHYTVSTTDRCDSLIVSYIGYNRVARAVKSGITQEINIGLQQGIELATVEILPGENPALRVLKKIIAN